VDTLKAKKKALQKSVQQFESFVSDLMEKVLSSFTPHCASTFVVTSEALCLCHLDGTVSGGSHGESPPAFPGFGSKRSH